MSIWGNPVLLGGSGGGGGGSTDPRTLLASWDFTGNSPLVDSVGGKTLTNYNSAISFSGSGAYFRANENSAQGLGSNQALQISLSDLLGSGASIAGCDIEIDTGKFTRYSYGTSNALRLFMATSGGNGFAYRQTSSTSTLGWSFYCGSWSSDYDPSPSIAYATVKISIAKDSSEVDTAYVNDFKLVESTVASLSTVATHISLGRTDATTVGGIYIRALRLYRRPT